MKIRRIASAASVAAALALAGPAVAHEPCPDDPPPPPSPCPEGYNPMFDVFNVSGADANDNDVVCVTTTPTGDIFVDDQG
jgi:hypothetical protein